MGREELLWWSGAWAGKVGAFLPEALQLPADLCPPGCSFHRQEPHLWHLRGLASVSYSRKLFREDFWILKVVGLQ